MIGRAKLKPDTAIVLAAQPVPPQVKLVNLPLSLDDSSVRVRVEGEGGDHAPPRAYRITTSTSESSPVAIAAIITYETTLNARRVSGA